MKKTNNISTKDKKTTKRASPITDPDCIYSWRTIPVSEAMVEKIAEELLEWPAKNPEAKTITEFYLSKGLTRSTYNRLVNRHEVLGEAHEITMRRLGERLWGRAVDNQAQWKPVHFMLHNYAQEFKESDAYHTDIKIQEERQRGIVVVHLPAIEKTKEMDRYLEEKNVLLKNELNEDAD